MRRPYQPRDPATTSRMMSQVRSSGNRAEVTLRKALYAKGLRYRIYCRNVFGRPDITFVRARVAVFVDGDFWHGRRLIEQGARGVRRQVRGARQEWWLSKIRKTVRRDAAVTKTLRGEGWKVLRFWESAVLLNTARIAERITSVVTSRTSRLGAP